MEQLIIFISVFIIALLFSMFGMGGGLIYMPVFLLFIDNYEVASLLSFSCIGVTACAAMSVYCKEKLIDRTLVIYLGIPLVAMVFVTGFIIRTIPLLCMKVILGATLTLAGMIMVFADTLNRPQPAKKDYRYPPIYFSPVAMAIGLLSGMSGVAGGVFEIPLMVGILRVPVHKAVATSSAIVFLAAVLGFSGRIMASHNTVGMEPSFLVGVLLCALIGGRLGPKISLNISKRIFKKLCGAFVLLIGLYYVIQGMK